MTTTAPNAERPALAAAIVSEAVQRIEGSGLLHDQAELQRAFHARSTRAEQVHERAWLLGERLGLQTELARWRHVAAWTVLGLALLVALAALAAARAVLAPDRSINAVAAFVSLLGWHALMLLLWLLGLLWPAADAGRVLAGFSLGRLALGLAARLPIDRGPHALTLLRASAAVLRRARLWSWLSGALSHAIWSLAFVLITAALAFGFAFHAYRLSWETTILSAEFFQRFVQVTGALPAWLGFPVPDAAAVQRVGSADVRAWQDAASQREWAWWLIGCVVAWGLLPRVLLALLSWWRWRAGQARLGQVDMADPYVRRIVQRLDALAPPPQVIDAERPFATPELPPPSGAPGAPGSALLIGFELPPELGWPPPGLPELPALRLAGSARERQAAIDQLAAARPESLLLVLHAPSSPDRGTARFLREALRQAGRGALLLVTADAAAMDAAATSRWRDWLAREGFEGVAPLDSAASAADWIASAHG